MGKPDKRLTALLTEADEIRLRLATADERHADAQAELTALRAKAGRGDSGALGSVADAQRLVAEAQNEIEIATAALAAVNADVEQARIAVTQAALQKDWREMGAIFGEIEQLAGQLDATPLDAETWFKLSTLAKRGESIYQNSLRRAAATTFSTVFPDVGQVATAFLTKRVAYCQARLSGKHSTLPPTLAESLGLDRVRARITNVKPA